MFYRLLHQFEKRKAIDLKNKIKQNEKNKAAKRVPLNGPRHSLDVLKIGILKTTTAAYFFLSRELIAS